MHENKMMQLSTFKIYSSLAVQPVLWSISSGDSQQSPPLVNPPTPYLRRRLPVEGFHIEPFRLCRGRQTVHKTTPASPFSRIELLDTRLPIWFATRSHVDSSERFHHGFPSATPRSRLGSPRREDIYAASPPQIWQPGVLSTLQNTCLLMSLRRQESLTRTVEIARTRKWKTGKTTMEIVGNTHARTPHLTSQTS